MEANGYQQQQPSYSYPRAGYAPPQGVGSAQAPPVFAQNKQEKARKALKCMAIADIVISSVNSIAWICLAIFVYRYFAVVLLAYTGSITASVLFLVMPKKKWPAILWLFWNIFRLLAEVIVPIVCWFYWALYDYEDQGKQPRRTESEHNNQQLLFVLYVAIWICYELAMCGTYITFLVFFGRHWCSFSESNGTGTEFQPPPTAPAGQPLYVQQPPEYQYQNPPPPQY